MSDDAAARPSAWLAEVWENLMIPKQFAIHGKVWARLGSEPNLALYTFHKWFDGREHVVQPFLLCTSLQANVMTQPRCILGRMIMTAHAKAEPETAEMGTAPCGQPTRVDNVHKLLKVSEHGAFRLVSVGITPAQPTIEGMTVPGGAGSS